MTLSKPDFIVLFEFSYRLFNMKDSALGSSEVFLEKKTSFTVVSGIITTSLMTCHKLRE